MKLSALAGSVERISRAALLLPEAFDDSTALYVTRPAGSTILPFRPSARSHATSVCLLRPQCTAVGDFIAGQLTTRDAPGPPLERARDAFAVVAINKGFSRAEGRYGVQSSSPYPPLCSSPCLGQSSSEPRSTLGKPKATPARAVSRFNRCSSNH